MHPLQYFERIYVINLPSREDRRREICRQLNAHGIDLYGSGVELFPGVRPDSAGGFRSVGARGCFMSHLAILQQAVIRKYKRILILEDDLNFVPDFGPRSLACINQLEHTRWHFFYGGHGCSRRAVLRPGLQLVPPTEGLSQTHFIGLCVPAIQRAETCLTEMLSRPAGHPEGGPMDVDGAYTWVRRRNPEFITLVAVAPLGYQRASRADISELSWFDKYPGIRSLARFARYGKNRIQSTLLAMKSVR